MILLDHQYGFKECHSANHAIMTLVDRRVSRGGARGLGAPPLEIEKQKKRLSDQILSYFTYILLLF